MNEQNLKPCPCGSKCTGIAYQIADELYRMDCERAECGWCVIAPNSEECATDWNTRADQPEAVEGLPKPYGWVALGQLFEDREEAIRVAEKTPVIDVFTRPQLNAVTAIVAELRAEVVRLSKSEDDWYVEAIASRVSIENLKAHAAGLAKELSACANALPGTRYVDLPDGGDVPVSEQLRRMADECTDKRAKIQELQKLSVTKILMNVTPGHDGMGCEHYAKNVDEVAEKLSELSIKNEELKAQLAKGKEGLPEPVAHRCELGDGSSYYSRHPVKAIATKVFPLLRQDEAQAHAAGLVAELERLRAENERLERKNANQVETIREYSKLTAGGNETLGGLRADLRVCSGERDTLRADKAELVDTLLRIRTQPYSKELNDLLDAILAKHGGQP